MPISEHQLSILGHSLGINTLHCKASKKKKDKKLPAEFYRNRFCAGEGHDDMPTLIELEKMGYMARGQEINEGRDILWYVTWQGAARFREGFESFLNS